MNCLSCFAETTNGLALCEMCRRKASTVLLYLPVYFGNLARWRPGRAGGSRQVPGSRVLYDGETRIGTGDKISDRLDEAAMMLTTWAESLTDDRGPFARPLTLPDAVLCGDLPEEISERFADHPEESVALLCEAFTEHLTSVATLEWAGEFLRDLDKHERALRELTERLVPGWYAGACKQCERSTYVVPGLTWVTCGYCGATTFARDHLETIIDEAQDWTARPKAIAEAVVALLDSETSVPRLYDRIRKWDSLGWLEPVRRTGRGYVWNDEAKQLEVADEEVGPKRYRLGDVLDRLTADAPRRVM